MKPIHGFLLLACLIAAAGQVLLKIGASGRQHWQEFINWPVFLGLAGYGLSTLLWLYCLSKLPLRSVYPYTALTFVLVVAAAVVLLGEHMSWRGMAGTALVFVGLGLLLSEQAH